MRDNMENITIEPDRWRGGMNALVFEFPGGGTSTSVALTPDDERTLLELLQQRAAERPVPTTDEPPEADATPDEAFELGEVRGYDKGYADGFAASPHPPTREQIAEAMPGRVEIHRIICGHLGGPSTHDHQACENAANAVHDALIQNGADR